MRPIVIPISFDELAEVLRACTWLRPDEGPPADPKMLMGDHRTHTNQGPARKVLDFDGPSFWP